MKDPKFKAMVKAVKKQFGNLTMTEVGMLYCGYAHLKDEKNKITLVTEEITEKKL